MEVQQNIHQWQTCGLTRTILSWNLHSIKLPVYTFIFHFVNVNWTFFIESSTHLWSSRRHWITNKESTIPFICWENSDFAQKKFLKVLLIKLKLKICELLFCQAHLVSELEITNSNKLKTLLYARWLPCDDKVHF